MTPAPELYGRTLHSGQARGTVLHLDEPLSFWGGVGEDGTVVDVHHPQHGQSLTGRVVVMRSGRGSSSSAAVLAQRLQDGTAPAALVLASCDTILVVGALVAAELYDVHLPIVQADPGAIATLAGHVHVTARPSGEALVRGGA
ncbi:aconitase X swivel domain-containing protein [Streptomyces sp. NPDC053499]|uniref:aconitase X swivel domain-containing protein n=1 Tax=Streptomyces sp. NPDC053499 TaxID=3365707 RepID=UPI0037D56A40